MATVQLNGVHKSFASAEIIKGVDITLHDGELTVLVGPSGCGKSTLLRLIAGLESITSGDLLIDGQRVNDIPPARRGLALVFQSYALYPHMTVAENMSFSLKLAGVSQTERQQRVDEAARILNLEDLLDRKPKDLSGGQRQRVAIGRAIVRHPKVFLFDEPLSNLDAALRVRMRLELTRLHRQLGATMIYVTHDQVEAMTMADRIVVLRAGIVEQVGSPMELYRSPCNLFVAGFIGSPKMNFLEGTVRDVNPLGITVAMCRNTLLQVPFAAPAAHTGSEVTIGLRPEHLTLAPAAQDSIPAQVQVVEHLGNESYLHVLAESGENMTVRVNGETEIQPEDQVHLLPHADRIQLFDAQGQSMRP